MLPTSETNSTDYQFMNITKFACHGSLLLSTFIVTGALRFSEASGLSQPCAAVPAGLVGWWPGDGHGFNLVGTNTAVLNNGASYTNGLVAGAFHLDGVNDDILIPRSPALNVGGGSGMTVELWIKPGDISVGRPLLEWGTAGVVGAHIWMSAGGGGGNNPGSLYANLIDVGGGFHAFFSGGGLISPNVYQHVAVTYRKSDGMAALYVNGVVAALLPIGIFTPHTSTDLRLGVRPANLGGVHFVGDMDELGIYNRALTGAEISAIYAAGAAGKCDKHPVILSQPQSQVGFWGKSVTFNVLGGGVAPITYQWKLNGAAIQDATNAMLVLTNLQVTDGGTFTAVVTDSYGSVTSAPAYLTVNPAGVSIALYAGVTIDGVVGLTYGIQATTNLNQTNLWFGLTNVTLNQPVQLWYDSQPANQPRRFYQVLPGPIPIP